MTTDDDTGLRRRDALMLLGGLGASAAASLPFARLAATADAATTTCLLTPEVTEGPYWIDTTLTRRRITDGKPGMPLVLDLTVVDARTCEAIAGADVEIWHCDAGGLYSGFESASQGGGGPGGGGSGPTDSKRYLRGHQKSDARGRTRFVSIFPGWYRGRTPHIHLKANVGEEAVHTGQLFMSERITASVYRTAAYRANGQPDTRHASDSIYRQAGGSKSTLKLTRRAGGKRGYRGTITLGVVS